MEAKSVDEVKTIRDKAEAMRAYAKQVGESLEVQNDIAEIKLRAERRIGEMIKETDLHKGGNIETLKQYPTSKMTKPDDKIKLSDIGISKYQSHTYQKIAGIPEEKFESLINEIKEDEKELTEAFMLNTAKKIDREINIQKQEEDINSGKIKLPQGKFEIIVVDPPWNYERKYDPKGSRVANPYPEMNIEEIRNIKLPTSNNCVLWLWTTQKFIWDAKQILEEWGFEYKAIMVWDKEKMGIGSWLRMQCEFCLLATKGKPIWKGTDIRDIIRESKTNHSTKPKILYELIEKNCVGRKLDYFARNKREGWDSYGNDINKFTQ